MEFSIVVTTFALEEGGNWERFRESLRAAYSIVSTNDAELLVIEMKGDSQLDDLLQREFPGARVIHAPGATYDDGKMQAAAAAKGSFILYLDGDCIPETGWEQHFLHQLKSGKTSACGGFTRYEGGLLAAIQSIMDFGFFYPIGERDLKCYASNNCAFVRDALLQLPMLQVDLRCSCYLHAQQFIRKGTPVKFVPESRVLHEMQPLVRERTRQGYDRIIACRIDPQLSEAKLLKLGIFSVPLLYAGSVLLDWKRITIARKILDLNPIKYLLALPLVPLLRLPDVLGMIRAFTVKQTPGGWRGWS